LTIPGIPNTAIRADRCLPIDDYRSTMDFPAHPDVVIAYETQARYDPDEGWVTLGVSASHLLALDDAFLRHDPWGRAPTELRVLRVRRRPRRHG
jgi:hypothetical protein